MPGVAILMKKQLGGHLTPADEESKAVMDKYKAGTVIKVKVSKPRNLKYHRKFFALLKVVFENQEKYTNLEDLREEVIVLAGYYTEHKHMDGTVSRYAKSISFGAMDEIEFDQLFAKAFQVILDTILPGADGKALQEAVDEVLSFV